VSAALALLAFGSPADAQAIQLVPLPVTPVSVSLRTSYDLLPEASGTGGATTSGSYTTSEGWQGTASFTATVQADRVDVMISGETTQAGTGTFYFAPLAELAVDVVVPEVGGPLTPIFWSVTDFEFQGSSQTVPCVVASVDAAVSSTIAGADLELQNGAVQALQCPSVQPANQAGFVLVPSGDTLRITRFVISSSTESIGQQVGTWSASFSIRFRTSAVTIGTGDVNGDGLVDVLDVTLIRRALAGLPPTP
jgi:hypothetical protein